MPPDPPICFFTSRGSSYKRSVPMLCPSNGDVLATPLCRNNSVPPQSIRSLYNDWLQQHYYDLANQSGQSTTNASFILRLADIAMHSDVRILFYTPQYLNIFTEVPYRLGCICLHSFVENICLIKMHRIFGHISLLFCKLLNC